MSLDQLRDLIARTWGFRSLRPLQEQAMRAVLEGRDSVVVLPTGGGKSLCYQAPAVLRGGTTVVISPLISLMKDQVDGLRACGVAAMQLDSSLSQSERFGVEMDLQQDQIRLLFVSPERLAMPDFLQLLNRIDVRAFAIDEAHCISHWGHDFRPDYRQLNRIKQLFPKASVHAYTATATQRVRDDIRAQLKLTNPDVLVGNFDRPNLTYRILPRQDLRGQVLEALERHRGEAGIIYCLRRKDVDDLNDFLQHKGAASLPYHAGLAPDQRRAAQEAFAEEKCDLVVATIAFGMGIDRSNIRFVLHATMPKSIEHYQQETGRAGRDGLEAECVLFYSGADGISWTRMLQKSASENNAPPEFLPSALAHVDDMDRYCRQGATCRHRALVEYFGQQYDSPHCGACDLCLGDTEFVPESVEIAQKILSCVARVKERFGLVHVSSVLRGEDTEKVRGLNHGSLSTFGLLKEASKPEVRDWIYQLLAQGVLVKDGDEYPVLKLNDASWEVMKGKRSVRLVRMARRRKGERVGKSKADVASWEGVDEGLFERLRELRRGLAVERKVPPYVIFSDATLRELARTRPATLDKMVLIYGIGKQKLAELGPRFLAEIVAYCRDHELAMDVKASAAAPPAEHATRTPPAGAYQTFKHFREGASIEAVAAQLGRTTGTVAGYLCDWICEEKPASIAPWVPDALYQQIAAAARQVGSDRLKPLFVFLEEKVPYDTLRLVVVHMNVSSTNPQG